MRALVREFTSACLTLRGCIRGCELANLPHHAALRFLFCHTQLRDDLRQVFLGHLDFDAVEQALSAGHERAHAGVGRRASQAGRAAGGGRAPGLCLDRTGAQGAPAQAAEGRGGAQDPSRAVRWCPHLHAAYKDAAARASRASRAAGVMAGVRSIRMLRVVGGSAL